MLADVAEPNPSKELELLNTGCVEAVVDGEVNEKMELADAPFDDPNTVDILFVVPAEAEDAPNTMCALLVVPEEATDAPNTVGALLVAPEEDVDAPNTIGELLVELEAVDAPKENPIDGDTELNVEPNAEDLAGCQPVPNKLGAAPLLEPMELVSGKEAEELSPVDPVLNSLAEVESEKELPDAGVVVPGKPKDGEDMDEVRVVVPVNPKDGEDEDEAGVVVPANPKAGEDVDEPN